MQDGATTMPSGAARARTVNGNTVAALLFA
jgi:hypothetical protein